LGILLEAPHFGERSRGSLKGIFRAGRGREGEEKGKGSRGKSESGRMRI